MPLPIHLLHCCRLQPVRHALLLHWIKQWIKLDQPRRHDQMIQIFGMILVAGRSFRFPGCSAAKAPQFLESDDDSKHKRLANGNALGMAPCFWGNMRKHEKPTCFDTHILFKGCTGCTSTQKNIEKKLLIIYPWGSHVVIYTKNRNVVKI